MKTKISDLERQKNLVRIANPQPRGKLYVVGVMQGLPAAPMNALAMEAKALAESILKSGYDVSGNRNFGSMEKGERLRQVVGARIKDIEGLGKRFRAEKARLKSLVANLEPVEVDYNKLGMIKYLQDERRIQQHNALTVGERAARIHQLRDEPGLDLSFAEAIIRTPADIEVKGIDWNLRNEIRVGLIKLLRNEAYENLTLQMDQLEFAENALRATVEIAHDVSGTTQDLLEHAPEAFSVTYGDERNDGVYWVPPRSQQSSAHMDLGIPPATTPQEVPSGD